MNFDFFYTSQNHIQKAEEIHLRGSRLPVHQRGEGRNREAQTYLRRIRSKPQKREDQEREFGVSTDEGKQLVQSGGQNKGGNYNYIVVGTFTVVYFSFDFLRYL